MTSVSASRSVRVRFATVFSVAAVAALFISLGSAGNALAVTTTYNCTGSAQTFTVPTGITSLAYTVKGAGGGNGGSGETAFFGTKSGGSGGTGAQYTGTWTVSPGDTVTIKVGCKGNNGADKRDGDGGGSGGWGFFTGGNGGSAGNRNCGFFGCSKSPTGGAGGGGGASGIQIGSLSVVAGGGGGGGGGAFWSNGGGAYGATQGAALANGSNGPKNGDGNGGSGASGGGGGNAGGGVGGDNGGNGGQNGRSAASSAGAISATLSATGGASGTNNGSVTITYFSAVSISGVPTGETSSTSVSATFATVDASTTFECKLDSGSWAACTSPYAITGLTEGSHTLSVRGKDSAGNTGGVNSETWTVDTTPPAKPVLTGGADGLTRQTRTSIAWSGDLTNGHTATCSIDGGSFTTCPASPATRTGLANGSYSFAVKVTDPAGNSSTTTRSWTVNTSAASSVSGDTGAATAQNVPITATAIVQARFTACTSGAAPIKCWGGNYQNLFSGGSLTSDHAPTARRPVDAMSDATEIALGYNHACGVFGGSVKCSGTNSRGQLGDGTITDSKSTAVAVQGITGGVSKLASGPFHTCAVLADSTVKCWGSNSGGQLGSGTATNTFPYGLSTPVSVGGVTGATDIAMSDQSTCAVVTAGAVKCWGDDNRRGLFGSNVGVSLTPTTISGLTGATKIGMSASGTACVLLSGGTVKCWGDNFSGTTGTGSPSTSAPYGLSTPTTVVGVTNAVDIGVYQAHACALISGGTAKCWGDNGSGQLGSGAAGSAQATPVSVSGLTNGVALSRGEGAFTCALLRPAEGTSGSRAKCWGSNQFGQLGANLIASSTSSPDKEVIEVTTPAPPAPQIAPPAATTGTSANITFKGERNATFECALDGGEWKTCTSPRSLTGLSDGWHTLSVRGTSTVGTGDASTVSWVADATPPATPTVSSTAVGTTRQTGATVTWNVTTEAGDTVTCSVDGGSFGACGTSPRTLTGLADGNHSFAVRATDSFGNSSTRTAAWKVDRSAATTVTGDTGDPTTTSADLAGVTAIDGDTFTYCAIVGTDRKVYCWGAGSDQPAMLGTAGPTSRQPVEIPGLSNVKQVSVGDIAACALLDDGTVKCWGDTDLPIISPGSSVDRTPVTIAGLSAVKAINLRGRSACAIQTDGKVKCWGATDQRFGGRPFGNTGMLGKDHTATPVTAQIVTSWPAPPAQPPAPVELVTTADGMAGSCVLESDGRVVCLDEVYGTYMQVWTVILPRPGSDDQVGFALVDYTNAARLFPAYGGGGTACAITKSADVECGLAYSGGNYLFQPSKRLGVSNVTDADGSYTHECYALSDGTAKCWGTNGFGQLGNGSTSTDLADQAKEAVTVAGLTGVSKIATGWYSSCALLASGKVKCWGYNALGQLGNGSTADSLTPTFVGGGTTTNPPPAPVIAAPSATTLTSADVTFKGEKGATFECKLDSGSWGACTSPKALTGLSTGWHNFSVRATNSGGTGEASTVSWIASAGSPPAKPTLTGAPSGTVKATTASISFTSDAGATFLCSLDGGPASACTSPRALSGLADGSHTLTVQAVKDSLTSEEASVTWTVDTTAPAAPTLSGAPTGTTGSKTASVSFTGEPGGTFQCSVDNGSFAPCTSPRSLSGLSDGAHNLRVTQTDSVGNVSPVATASWTVVSPPAPDVTPPPVPTLSGAPASLTNSKSASIGFTSEAGATFTCSVDGGSYSSCASPRALSNLSDGPHSLAVKARDAAGNVSDPATANWTVDTVAPAKPVLSGAPSGATSKQTASLSVIAEAGTTLKCRIDGGDEATCASPIELKDLADGEHGVLVRAVDDAGNVSAAAAASWDVDTLAPSVTLTGAPKGTVTTRTASISIATEQAATVTCSVDGGAFSACSGKVDLADLADGEHSLAVKAVDAAENYALVVTDKWVVDATAPGAPTLFGAPSGTTSQDGATVSFTSEPGATFTCSVDGGGYAPCTSPKALSGLAEGAHQIAVKAKDSAGNEGPAATASWTVDTTPPSIPVVTGAPAQATALKSITLAFSSSPGAAFTCSVDGGAFSSCTSPRTLTGLSEGSHSFVVLATDSAGNVSEPGTAEWYVAGDYLPPGRTTTAIVTWKAPKPNGTGNTWYINAGASFTTAGDARVGAQILTIQVSTAKTKPLNTQAIPTTATFANGVLAWNSGNVERTSLDRPMWIRVGNRTGKWTGWFQVALKK